MEASQLKIYSLGTVAANKKLTSREIEVTPIEDSPMTHGEITDNATKYSAAASDSNDAAYSVEVLTSVTVKATWLPMGGSNRMTAPDVRRGELVALYRFADSDQFWWTTLKDDMNLRKLETVIYAFSATPVEATKNNSDSMYFLEISTHNKLVHFHTSKANGEPYMYDIQINAAEGFIQIQDDAGNYFRFDSKEHQIEMVNQDGSKVEVTKTNINFQCTDTISLKSKTISQESTTNNIKATTVMQKSTTSTISAGSMTFDSSGEMKLTGSSISID